MSERNAIPQGSSLLHDLPEMVPLRRKGDGDDPEKVYVRVGDTFVAINVWALRGYDDLGQMRV